MVVSDTTEAFEPTLVARRARGMSSLLPREHGGWALVLEPLTLALIVAPSWRGAALAGAALALFLMRRPWQCWRAQTLDARGAIVGRALVTLGGLAALLGATACFGVFGEVIFPLGAAGLAGAAFAWLDARGEGRALAAELSGVLAFSALAMVTVCLAGEAAGRVTSLAVAVCCAMRGSTSILPIRAYLRRRKGQDVSLAPSIIAAAVAVLACFVVADAMHTWVPLAWAVVFALRTLWLLGPWAPQWPARRLGVMEACLGLAAVLTTGLAIS